MELSRVHSTTATTTPLLPYLNNMARLAGFAGGAVLTFSLSYLAVTSIRQRAARNSATLRECRDTLEALQKPPTIPENVRPYIARPSLVETLKDRWNDEVTGVWRWATGLDAVRIRESVEKGIGNVWGNLKDRS